MDETHMYPDDLEQRIASHLENKKMQELCF
jgi:hypothetical protein